MSINDCNTMCTDVVYFDFLKAFDSVNHDLILNKLKVFHSIDGRLLKFLSNYLSGRKQCVTIGNYKSSQKNVLSGVSQGSILGPIPFVLFINDMPQGIDPCTNVALYEYNTKIWRNIVNSRDIALLQKHIDYLNQWSINNMMNFHLKKCKVASINHNPSILSMLPFVAFHYYLGENLLEYTDNEKDLGVYITSNFRYKIISRANQKLGMLRRTCNFVNDVKRRRILYLTLVRSQSE